MAILGFDLSPLKQGVQDAFAALRQASQDGAQPAQAVSRVLSAPQPTALAGQAWQTLSQVAQQGGMLGPAWGALGGDGGYGGGLAGRAWQTLDGGVNYGGLTGRALDTLGGIAVSTAPAPAPMGVGATAGATAAGATASGGPYGNHEQYRASIQKWAQANGIDPDALAAILQIEVPSGDPRATSPVGARGLGQIMPGTWAGLADPGDDPYDADASIKNAAKYYASLYRQFGDYGLAAAAYQGGPGAIVNGQARNDVNDGNLTPAQYAARWQQNYQGIKQAAPQRATAQAGSGGLASITPGVGGTVMQEFGPTEYAAEHPSTYTYANQFGLDGAQHPGVDWAVPIGTQVATPLGGTVSVVGSDHGTGYYYTNTMTGSDPDHSGEFAVTLDNGDILILGHMSNIGVNVGDRVSPGQIIGLSGGSDGAHIHVEYRQRQPDGSYRIIDPRTVLGGTGGDNTGNR